MIASNPRRTDSAAVRSISYVAAHVLPLNYAFFFFLFCCVFFFYNGKHIVSCICLHLIMSSQCVHWHACCVMLSVSPARVCMHVLTCVASRARCCAPVPHRWWSFSWPSPLSLLSCGFSYKAGWWGGGERRLRRHEQLEYFSHVDQNHPPSKQLWTRFHFHLVFV